MQDKFSALKKEKFIKKFTKKYIIKINNQSNNDTYPRISIISSGKTLKFDHAL